ncbi:class I SAM-dependent methyltransferase [Bacillus sp. FJAT-27251]|uniref:class I SAM-dependent methyltransferase n=1 Tax=Bacillus sp. FJAT-27251 TaxID=1684142 RepID=UPI0006A782B2|nr:class I SAM-dependent methyltransferase [Bacillus sp. FJAT-27251]
MNNTWNGIIYKIWAPLYDRFFNAGPFLKARQSLFQDVTFNEGDRVLFVGVGTGADLEQIPRDKLDITAIDYSQDMLDQARRKFPHSQIQFLQMDAQHLDFESETFDYVVGSLILTVVPDGEKAFSEMARVAKRGGTILVFDKFAPEDRELSFLKKLVRPLIRVLGTDIGISFKSLSRKHKEDVNLKEDRELAFNGMYRKITLIKK